MKPLIRLAFLWLVLSTAASTEAAQLLRSVPSALDPAKAYALVEVRNHDGGRQAGSVVFARYDPTGGDVRGGTRSPGSSLGRGVPVRIAVSRRTLARTDESRLYLLEIEPDTWVIEGAAGTAFRWNPGLSRSKLVNSWTSACSALGPTGPKGRDRSSLPPAGWPA